MSDLLQKTSGNAENVLPALAPAELEKAKAMAASIDLADTQAVIQFGTGAQSRIASFADTILTEIRNKDSGYVGEVLGGLVSKIREIDVGSLGTSGNFWSSIPIIGNLVDSVRRFISRYEKLSVQIEKIIMELETARMNLLKDITMLDSLFSKNLDFLKELDIVIAAGKLKIEEFKDRILPELKAKADASNDPADAQRFQDMNQLLNRFEKKLHDLQLSRMLSIQTGPQIRLIQNNDQTLVEKIQSSILTTIPLWKNQIIIAISLFRQKKALALQKEVTDTTNELITKNSEMLKIGSIGVARESERGIIEIETLKKVNDDLISTIDETLKIQKEGREKRAAAETELRQMENELKARLKSVQSA